MKDDYIVFNAHKTGASHISRGTQCEDYSASCIDDFAAIAVISDGHGDKNCFRSGRGARFACDTAIRVTKNTVSTAGAEIAIMNSPDRIICELEKSIIFNWQNKVERDIIDDPFKDEELRAIDEAALEAVRSGKRLTKVYGCTLIMAVVMKSFWFGIHIGDGRCICIQENGAYLQPIPWDEEGCVGNRSTSLCDTRAFDKFRYTYGRNIPTAVFVGSDGVDESFDDNGINKFYFSLANWLKNMPESEYTAKTDELLSRISRGGSGDDVSVSCIINRKKELIKPFSTSRQVADKMEDLYKTIRDTEEICSQLNESENKLSSEIDELNRSICVLEAELVKKKKQLEDRTSEYESIRKKIINMKNRIAPVIKQFSEAKDIKRQVDEYWLRMGGEIYDNGSIMNYVPPNEMLLPTTAAKIE